MDTERRDNRILEREKVVVFFLRRDCIPRHVACFVAMDISWTERISFRAVLSAVRMGRSLLGGHGAACMGALVLPAR